jgi:hypothetical protein
VKKLFKIAVIVGISILYCFILGTYSGNVVARSVPSPSSEGAVFYSSGVSNSLFYHTEQSQSLTGIYSQSSRTTVKNSFNQFSACPVATEKLLFIKYLPYVFYSRLNIVWFKSTDIIFPFHYFW